MFKLLFFINSYNYVKKHNKHFKNKNNISIIKKNNIKMIGESMKTKIKNTKKFLSVLLICMFLMLNIQTFATSTTTAPATLTLDVSKNSINEGDSLILDLKISNITLSSGVSKVTMNLDMDDAIFDMVRRVDIKEEAGWTMSYNSTTKLLNLTTTQKIKKDASIAKITMKAKTKFDQLGTAGSNQNSTTISLKNIKINSVRDLDDVSVKLSLKEEALPEDPIKPGVGGSTEKPKTNPKAGLDNVYVISIISLGFIAILSVLGHKKASGKIG